MTKDDMMQKLADGFPGTYETTALKARILARVHKMPQDMPLRSVLKPFFKDWRWLSAELATACAVALLGFYLGEMVTLNAAADAWIESSTAVDFEEDWTL